MAFNQFSFQGATSSPATMTQKVLLTTIGCGSVKSCSILTTTRRFSVGAWLSCINELECSSPASGEGSSGILEELVHKADLIADAWLARGAVSAPDYPHDLEAFDRGDGSHHGLKASCWLDDSFQ